MTYGTHQANAEPFDGDENDLKYVIKKRERIISKVKSKYLKRTHKLGIRIPKTPEEAKRLGQSPKVHLSLLG